MDTDTSCNEILIDAIIIDTSCNMIVCYTNISFDVSYILEKDRMVLFTHGSLEKKEG